MARAALLRGKFRSRRRRFTPLSAIHFTGSLALAQPANTVALNGEEEFLASIPATQANATLSIAGTEKFFETLALNAPANTTFICVSSAHYPGRASIADAMQGGLLTMNDLANGSLAAADQALYDVQITETV